VTVVLNEVAGVKYWGSVATPKVNSTKLLFVEMFPLLLMRVPFSTCVFAVMSCVDHELGYAGLKSYAWLPGGTPFIVLLFSVAAGRAPGVLDAFRRRGEECWEIGEVLSEPVIRVTA